MTSVTSAEFGRLPNGEPIRIWTLVDRERDLAVAVCEWGATIQSVRAPDRRGRVDEIALGFPALAGYINAAYRARNPYFGATIGRFANRIARGRFELEGVVREIPANDGVNALHGGPRGFDQRRWDADGLPDGVCMHLLSPDGEEGFPGALDVEVRFRLADGALTIEYEATTDHRTVVNLTNHSYWNLAGAGERSATDHLLLVAADSYLPVDETLIPIGTLEPVANSPLDFRRADTVESHLVGPHLQLERAGGIDHTFVLRPGAGAHGMRDAIAVSHPGSGRRLRITTTEPGVQVYTGNFLDGSFAGHGGRRYRWRSGLAFETQHFPDSPNRPAFPSTSLSPGMRFRSSTRYELSAEVE
jgi:aldose 1-epimerase